jgi:hypothetical protein
MNFVQKNKNTEYRGYIDSNSKEYSNILEEHSWLLFPAIEEGEPGTVIEDSVCTGNMTLDVLGTSVPGVGSNECMNRFRCINSDGKLVQFNKSGTCQRCTNETDLGFTTGFTTCKKP